MAVELYDEHEQSERVRKWLRENGFSIFMGVALALAGLFGWRQWQDYQVQRSAMANEYYSAVQSELERQNLAAADQQYQAMTEAVKSHAYVSLAGMLLASAMVENGQTEQAAALYRELLDSVRQPALEPLLRLRLAALETALGQGESALGLLEGEVPAGYAGIWHETRADALFDLGRLADAADEYRRAIDSLGVSGQDSRQAEIKLDTVQSRLTANHTS
ncbi:MAG: YfgM family protein [Wenzhouxiangellaceae bacterium]